MQLSLFRQTSTDIFSALSYINCRIIDFQYSQWITECSQDWRPNE